MRFRILAFVIWTFAGFCSPLPCHASHNRPSWTNNLLTNFLGRTCLAVNFEFGYLEASLPKGSTHRTWKETTLPHHTELVAAGSAPFAFPHARRTGRRSFARGPRQTEKSNFNSHFITKEANAIDLEWFQPACIRVIAVHGQ